MCIRDSFAGFDGMTVHGNWTGFFLMLGGLTSAAGVLGLCIFRDSPALRPVQGDTYLRDVLYAFRPANIRANKMIYICFLGMMFSGLAMQLWQPYMISLVEVTLGIDNYILPIGIVVLASAVLSVLAGKAMDRFGKEKFCQPPIQSLEHDLLHRPHHIRKPFRCQFIEKTADMEIFLLECSNDICRDNQNVRIHSRGHLRIKGDLTNHTGGRKHA